LTALVSGWIHAMEIQGSIHNGQIIVAHPELLPEGAAVTVIVRQPSAESSLANLLELAGTVDELPADMARNHDHYVHGHPKQ
jgi:hypothetical protein